ncbi:MAG: hypothetical protein KC643_32470 [Nitrospira sp.]|nr:hypothetical protein [Nitrospira sp.]
MNPVPDWVDNLSEDVGTLSAALKDKKKFVAAKTTICFGKAGYATMALPLLAYAGSFDVPTIKPVPVLNDHVMLATYASTPAPVHGLSGASIFVGSTDDISIGPANGVVAFFKIR